MQLTNEWYLFTGALDKDICDRLIELGADEFKQAEIDVGNAITPEQRVKGKPFIHGSNSNIRTSDVKGTTEQWAYDLIWPFMQIANEQAGWKFDIQAAEPLQITRYQEGGFYRWHKDGK